MEETMVLSKQGDDLIDLPPGFRFHPTDEEIITHYLQPRAINHKFTAYAVTEVDLNRVEPWEMPSKAKIGEKEWYFFCQKDRKYPTGTRTNRATKSGYWKATGKDKEIYKGKGGSHRQESIIGMKKTLVFYMGRAPKGEKTNWVMHEYRLEGKFPQYYKLSKDEWVVCRVFHKTTGIKRGPGDAGQLANTFMEDMLEENSPPPPLMDPSTPSGGGPSSSSFTDCGGDYEHKMKAEIMSRDELFSFPTSPTNYYCPPTYDNINNNNYSIISPGPNINHYSFQPPRHHNMQGLNQCKVESYSLSNNNINLQGSVSQNTGISTDVNNATPEISSSVGVSKQEIMSSTEINNTTTMTMMMLNKEFDMDGLADLECFWDF